MKGLIRFVLNRVPRKRIQQWVHIVTPLAGVAYAGRGVKCPVCGARYRKLLPYGYSHSRENALCPCCLALERHRLMWLYLCRETDFFEAHPKVLHIAPERCFIKRFGKLLGNNYVTADLESPLAKIKMDVQDIPCAADEFDVIFCNHILEHVDDDRRAMREMLRVMRPGGWGLMLVPQNFERETTFEDPAIDTPEKRYAAFGQSDHVREYGCDYAARLAEEGFEVEPIDYVKHLTAEEAKLYALRSEILYIVRKPLIEELPHQGLD